jgi:imidazolonepropionase-like amidohydrolase
MHRHQNHEFRLRGEVQPALDVLRSATSGAADLLNLTGEIGTLAPGAYADLLVVDRDPLEDIGVLAEPKHFRHIIQGGTIV